MVDSPFAELVVRLQQVDSMTILQSGLGSLAYPLAYPSHYARGRVDILTMSLAVWPIESPQHQSTPAFNNARVVPSQIG